jgi:hypothetical protein
MTPLAAALRVEFARHNQRVLLLAGLTLIIAASLWYLVYAVMYWLTLLGVTIVNGVEAKAPDAFPTLFIYSGGVLVLITAMARRWSPNDVPRDHESTLECAAGFLLAIPRATLAVWGNLSAWQRLDGDQLELAAVLVERLVVEERVPLYQVPLLIPNRTSRCKVVFALQLVQLVELHHASGGAFLRLSRRAKCVFNPRRVERHKDWHNQYSRASR